MTISQLETWQAELLQELIRLGDLRRVRLVFATNDAASRHVFV
jgi:hypothetical protein